jgi:hypothetical protein
MKWEHCKYCGARLKKDAVGQYCPTHNCQWHRGLPKADDDGPPRRRYKPKIHIRLGSRAEGVAFLCRNWDKKRHSVANDTQLETPLEDALRRSTTDNDKVTCQECRRCASDP